MISSDSSDSSDLPEDLKNDGVGGRLDPTFLALSRLRRRRLDGCLAICDDQLAKNPLDRALWYVKTRALTLKTFIDDTDIEEEGIAEILLDENAIAKAPRPGTSIQGNSSSGPNASIRPVSSSGRPLSGFARPGTKSRLNTGQRLDSAFQSQGARPGTSRPISVSGRNIRLGTQSMLLGSGEIFIDPSRIDVKKFAKKPLEAKVLIDYLLYHAHNPRVALDLCSECTQASDYKDWWFKARLGKCYYQLGLYREAEEQFQSSLRQQAMITTFLELSKIFLRRNQPNNALDTFMRASERYQGDISLILGIARVYELLNDPNRGLQYYKKALHYEANNVEAIASLAANAFYSDQPEIALRFYRRLLQMGVSNAEIWNNLGLCCFYSSQYDMTLSCMEKALSMADNEGSAEVYYNLSQIAIGIGDLNLAYQALKLALSHDANHAESYNNLGILELRKGNIEQARSCFQFSGQLSPHLFEPFYNAGLVAFKLGDCQAAYENVEKSSNAFPDHTDSKDLIKQLRKQFIML